MKEIHSFRGTWCVYECTQIFENHERNEKKNIEMLLLRSVKLSESFDIKKELTFSSV